ncbi:DUF1552 domain-containing protein [Marinagarivorans algicola]|uniref:DUF1552 domain-containing protein n=1 Tax=Marinagarivorans algicola TaxID=1513270 RepID=UPI0006B5B80B|nr:DUF1552 domain-containing protein [Marinagarivorans algicola]
MKAIDEILQHHKHEHTQLDIQRLALIDKEKNAKSEYFKKYARDINTRRTLFRKNRRQLLDFLGRTGVASGVLRTFPAIAGVLGARHAIAQETTRAVFCYINSGAPNGYWLPKSQTEMNLVTEPYADVASICHFREVDAVVAGHGRATTALGARAYGQPTSDSIAAPALSASTPFSSIFLGSDATGQDISAYGKPKSDPLIALKDYFSSGAGDNDGPDTTYLKVYQAQMRAIEGIKNKLSADERERLQEHSAALEKIETRITDFLNGNSIDPSTCAPTLPPKSDYILTVGAGEQTKMLEHGKVQADIIIAALKCGLTNVATLQLGAESGTWKTHGVNHYGGFTGDSHGSVHAGYSLANKNNLPISYVECHRYLSQVPAYLIKQLMNNNGPDGKPLIDTTAFAQVTCMGNGMDHTTSHAPFILATRLPSFNTGFSALNQSATNNGSTYDFNETVLKGLGVAGDFPSANTLGLV